MKTTIFKKKGWFTLIELLVVIAIIAILAGRLRNIFSVNSLKSSQYFRCNVYSR